MNKIFTTLLILSGFYSIATAQTKTNVEFGANVGCNFSYVTFGAGSGQSSDLVTGFNAGLSVDKYFSDSWSLKVKAIYDQKGWGNGFLRFPDGTEVDGVDFKLDYITVPVMANWHFGNTRNWYLNFGPYVGFLTSAKAAGIDVKDIFNTTDVGFDAGIGVKFPISERAKFFIELDGQSGFTNMFLETSDGSSVQSARSSINFGINF